MPDGDERAAFPSAGVADTAPPTREDAPGSGRRRLSVAMAVVTLVVALVSLAGLPGRATRGGQTTADEPQYLLTAHALFHRQDLDIGPELRARTWKAFHRAPLPRQTAIRPHGQRLSPHDPLLPLLLAVPYGLGGWVGAKVALSLLAGTLAALLVWTAVRRFGVDLRVAAAVVAGFGVVPPLTSYGTQVYPEVPAALAVAVAIAALTGAVRARTTIAWVLAVVALPWLAVKYAPVAAVLAAIGLARCRRSGSRRWASRRPAVVAAAVLVFSGLGFLAFHRAVYGGWTVYAAGDHFVDGELTVMGQDPDYPSRTIRLVGLLVDHDFGLLAWAPAYLALVPALAALARRRPPGWAVLALPFAAGWLNATFVALTMHGWWWPGRQVVVVLPGVVLAVAWWFDRVVGWARARAPFAAATAFGLLAWSWLQVEVARGTRTVIVTFAQTANPLSKAWRLLLPDDRQMAVVDGLRLTAWIALLVVSAAAAWHHAGGGDVRRTLALRWAGRTRPPASSAGDEDAGAGERADAHVAAVDAHGGGAVG